MSYLYFCWFIELNFVHMFQYEFQLISCFDLSRSPADAYQIEFKLGLDFFLEIFNSGFGSKLDKGVLPVDCDIFLPLG